MKTGIRYYVLKGEKTEGPFSMSDLAEMAQDGGIDQETLCSYDGAESWRPVWQLFEEARRSPVMEYSAVLPWLVLYWLVALCVACSRITMTAETNVLAYGAGMVVLVFLSGLVYLVPSFLAVDNKHKNQTAITVLNFFLGWTFVGGVVALVWAVKR